MMLRWIAPIVALVWGLLAPTMVLAQTVVLLPNGEQQFVDSNGQPLSGGWVYFYVPGTTTPKNTWQDPNGTTLNSDPVQLDGAGRGIIYGSGAYRQVLQDQYHNTIWDQFTFGFNPALFGNLAAKSVICNPQSTTLPPIACSVLYPLSITTSGLGFQQATIADNTNISVSNLFDYTIRLATSSITYGLPFSSNMVNGFSFSGYTNANTVVLQAQGTDTINGGSAAGSLTIPANSSWTIVTNGAGQWYVSVATQLTSGGSLHGFVGETIKMRTASCPTGTLLEDGTAYSRATYASLFAVLGTTWGAGDGSTTFNVPNAEGVFDRNFNPTASGPDASRTFAAQQAFSNGPVTGSVSFSPPSVFSSASGPNSVGAGGEGGAPVTTWTCTNCGSEARPVNNTVESCIVDGL
jgi:Phage Tail Collar Domain